MNKVNRYTAPSVHIAKQIALPTIEEFVLDNGLKIYAIKSPHQVLKIDFTFEAGKWYEEKNLTADFATRLMREGTKRKSAFEIHDTFDFYGSNLEEQTYFSNAGFQLFTLHKNAPQILPLIKELFTEASFTEQEFLTLKENRQARHLQNLAKPDYRANRALLGAMWGRQHPYGRATNSEDFDALNPDIISDFFYRHFTATNCFIILSGNYDESLIKHLNETFGQQDWIGTPTEKLEHTISPDTELVHTEVNEDAVQTSVMIGCQGVKKSDKDFDGFSVLNTLLGGYFGSRLMTNIREEKGYTYGIYSANTAYRNGSIFEISADVGKEYREATIHEIKAEIERLQNDKVPEDELQTVKNYMTGRVLRSVDGAFRFAEVWKSLLLFDKPKTSLNEYLETIHSINQDKILTLAQRYLDYDKMYKIEVG